MMFLLHLVLQPRPLTPELKGGVFGSAAEASKRPPLRLGESVAFRSEVEALFLSGCAPSAAKSRLQSQIKWPCVAIVIRPASAQCHQGAPPREIGRLPNSTKLLPPVSKSSQTFASADVQNAKRILHRRLLSFCPFESVSAIFTSGAVWPREILLRRIKRESIVRLRDVASSGARTNSSPAKA